MMMTPKLIAKTNTSNNITRILIENQQNSALVKSKKNFQGLQINQAARHETLQPKKQLQPAKTLQLTTDQLLPGPR